MSLATKDGLSFVVRCSFERAYLGIPNPCQVVVGATDHLGVVGTPRDTSDRVARGRQGVKDNEGGHIVDDDGTIFPGCRQAGTIVREGEKPDLVRVVIQCDRGLQGKLIAVTHVFGVQRRGCQSVVVEAIGDLGVLDLIQKNGQPTLREHDQR